MIDGLEAGNAEVKECVRKFDADLSLKAGKTSIAILKQDLEDNYLGRVAQEKINARFAGLDNQFREHYGHIRKEFDDIKRESESLIEKICGDEVVHKLE